MKQKDQLIRMGWVASPHGLKGEAEIRLLNQNFDECVLDDGMEIFLFPTNEKSKVNPKGETWTLEKIRFGNKVLAVFKGMRDRTHLESLIPFEIYLDRDQFPETDDDEVYLVDLVGLDVVSPEGEKLGKLEAFSDNGMQYIFEVRLLDGGTISLPYVDAFFPEIDTENGKIVMVLPEYTE